jgi:FkbM family methyltransferase
MNNMNNTFYGQFEPKVDRTIKEYFPNQNIGNCIEVGSVDGISYSNTYHFEKIGWNCMCIEPVTSSFNVLKQNRKIALNYAISEKNADNENFNLITIDNVEQPNSAVSGLILDEKLLNDLKRQYSLKEEVIKVSTRRLDWCIENFFNHDTIDFISIDTEGSELDVLKSFDVNSYNTKLLVIENNHNDSIIESYLNQKGWKKDRRLFVNDFYIKQ